MIPRSIQSQPDYFGLLLGGIVASFGVVYGIKIIIRREIKAGPRGGPYQTIRGRYAIQMGIGIILFGLSFLFPEIITFFKHFKLP